MIERQHGRIIWVCDGCSENLETEERDFDAARAALRDEGWMAKKVGIVGPGYKAPEWQHICPNCQERRERKR